MRVYVQIIMYMHRNLEPIITCKVVINKEYFTQDSFHLQTFKEYFVHNKVLNVNPLVYG